MKSTHTDELDFVACVSHDLKSPLNAILGYVSLIQEQLAAGQPAPEAMLHDLKMVQGIGEDMLALINNMLVAARVHSSREALLPVVVEQDELRQRAEGLARTFASEARSRKVDFAVELRSLPERVHWDIQKVRYFAVNNLISNALKFVGEGGMVRLGIDTDDAGNVVISVSDNGPGIPQVERPNIFKKFVQASNNVRSHQGGGFGLYNAASIVAMHGGTIEVGDGIDGRGASFRLSLPAIAFEIESDAPTWPIDEHNRLAFQPLHEGSQTGKTRLFRPAACRLQPAQRLQ